MTLASRIGLGIAALGTAHRWAALFSEDAVLVPAGQPSVSGWNRIEEWGEIAMKRMHVIGVALAATLWAGPAVT